MSAHLLLPTLIEENVEHPNILVHFQRLLFRTNERATYPAVPEFFTALVFFAMWVVLRKITFTHLLVNLARKMGAKDELTEYKWCVLAWNGIFHTWSTLWLLWWLPQRRWYWNTEFLWENILAEKPQKMELEFKAFYMLQLGYHLQSIGWHFVEERRPDFATMMVHHVVTVMLIVGSYVSHFSRIGMLVLLVHDSSDIFVCITKCFHMCGWKKPAHVCFGLMVLAWAYTRLYLYPFWVIGSTWTYPESHRFGLTWCIFVAMMVVLLCLHAWWFHLFIKMAMGIAKHGSGEDITENKGAEAEKGRDAAYSTKAPQEVESVAIEMKGE